MEFKLRFFGSVLGYFWQLMRPLMLFGILYAVFTQFVKLGEAFGLAAWRCESVEDFGRHLTHAMSLDRPSLIVLPIDYSIDVAISEELGTETVAT